MAVQFRSDRYSTGGSPEELMSKPRELNMALSLILVVVILVTVGLFFWYGVVGKF